MALDPKEVRCRSRILGIVTENGSLLEIKCSSKLCGAAKGVVVFHYIELSTMNVVETKRFKDPSKSFEGSKQKEVGK